eukprot:sb/3476920/
MTLSLHCNSFHFCLSQSQLRALLHTKMQLQPAPNTNFRAHIDLSVTTESTNKSQSRILVITLSLHCNSFHFCLSQSQIWALLHTKIQLKPAQIPIFEHILTSPLTPSSLPGKA